MTTFPDSSAAREMSLDPRFGRRLRRLIGVSLVALGLVTTLALAKAQAEGLTIVLLASGWALMPTLLYFGLKRPRWRYLLTLPAALVAAGLLRVNVIVTEPAVAVIGWWLITVGVIVGAGLGGWFWYRWLPVPTSLEDPFSTGRWTLIAIHIGLIAAGTAMVLVS